MSESEENKGAKPYLAWRSAYDSVYGMREVISLLQEEDTATAKAFLARATELEKHIALLEDELERAWLRSEEATHE